MQTILFRVLCAIVVLSPLPLGSNRPIWWSALAVAVGLLLLLWSVGVLLGKLEPQISVRRFVPMMVPFALVVIWASVQSTPGLWPHPIWGEAFAALAINEGVGTITLDPALTKNAVLRLLTYGGLFWLSVQLGRDRTHAKQAVHAVAWAAIVYAAYGLTVFFAGVEKILWLDKWAYQGDLTATFVNRNSYGSYAGVGLVVCLALFANGLRKAWQPKQDLRDRTEALMVQALPFLGGALVVGTALMQSHSRGAFASTAVAILVLLAALGIGKVLSARRAMMIGMVLLGMGGIVALSSGERTLERFALEGTTDSIRQTIYDHTEIAIADAPLTGFGFGSFAPAFRLYRDVSLPQSWEVDKAHNVFLETAFDLGIPAAMLLCLAVLYPVWICVLGVGRRRRDQIYPAIAVAASVLLGLHGLVDFSLQIPAIAATLAFLVGIGFAQSFNTISHGSR